MGNPTNMSGDQAIMDMNIQSFNGKCSPYMPLFVNNNYELSRVEFIGSGGYP
jgi:hypothetical protein